MLKVVLFVFKNLEFLTESFVDHVYCLYKRNDYYQT